MKKLSIILLLGFSVFYGGSTLAYEEPHYRVIKSYTDFELRRYARYIVAETYAHGQFLEVGGKAFRRLFSYISEENRPQGGIEMTAPVIQQPASIDHDGSGTLQVYRFAFVMPADYALEDLPIPESNEIVLQEVPERLMAARRYSGTWSEERYRKNEKILLEAIKQKDLVAVGEPVFARYNAPFSLWFLRRNEVLVEVKSAGD